VSGARKTFISPLFPGRLIRIRAHIGSLCHSVSLVCEGVGRRGLSLSVTITGHLSGTVDPSIAICCPRGGFLDNITKVVGNNRVDGASEAVSALGPSLASSLTPALVEAIQEASAGTADSDAGVDSAAEVSSDGDREAESTSTDALADETDTVTETSNVGSNPDEPTGEEG
jgi:hypothetical protein